MTPVSQTGEGGVLQGEGPAAGQPGDAWTPAFPGQRPPFQPGNRLAVGHGAPPKHGAYSRLRLSKRAEEIAEELAEIVPAGGAADRPTIVLLATVLARIEAADRALGTLDETTAEHPLSVYLTGDRDKLERLRQDLRGWVGSALKLSEALGLTPRARAGLGLALKELAPLDLGRLETSEEDELRRLLAKAAGVDA